MSDGTEQIDGNEPPKQQNGNWNPENISVEFEKKNNKMRYT